jgi:hypothetical protein
MHTKRCDYHSMDFNDPPQRLLDTMEKAEATADTGEIAQQRDLPRLVRLFLCCFSDETVRKVLDPTIWAATALVCGLIALFTWSSESRSGMIISITAAALSAAAGMLLSVLSESRCDAIESRFDTIDSRLDTIDASLNTILSRLPPVQENTV